MKYISEIAVSCEEMCGTVGRVDRKGGQGGGYKTLIIHYERENQLGNNF